MSLCPTKDIHSLYLDNEMPEIYKSEYENHVKDCQKCQNELNKLRKLHQLFNADSDQITPDIHYLDQSFERLQVKMNFSKHVIKSSNSNSKFRYLVPSVAAAAVAIFALSLSINTRMMKTQGNNLVQNYDFVSSNVVGNNVAFNNGRSTVISGNIHDSVNSTVFLPSAKNVSISDGTGVVISGNIKESLVRADSASRYRSDNPDFIRNVEVFSPAINDEGKISIKITVPNMDKVPVCTEIEVPINRAVITGQ